jgi:hypothetical protein
MLQAENSTPDLVVSHRQNAGVVKIFYRITFSISIKAYVKHQWVPLLDLGPVAKRFLKVSYGWIFINRQLFQNLKYPKHFWSQAFQIRETQPIAVLETGWLYLFYLLESTSHTDLNKKESNSSM